MKTTDRNTTKRQVPDTESDIRKSERDLRPHTGMRPDKFPESIMSKDQRKDTEGHKKGTEGKKKDAKGKKKDTSDIESLASDTEATVGSRVTSRDPEDIAGVADLDRGLGRAKRH